MMDCHEYAKTKPINPMDMRIEPRRNEKLAIERLVIVESQLEAHEKHLEARLRSIPDGYRRWRMVKSVLAKLMIDILDTLPLKTLKAYSLLLKRGDVVIKIPGAARENEYVVVSDSDMEVIAQYAISGACTMCLRSGGEVRSCPLRRALNASAPLEAQNKYSECPYKDFALEHAREVSI